jgi:outer membrane receptor protein involved in Fe transport
MATNFYASRGKLHLKTTWILILALLFFSLHSSAEQAARVTGTVKDAHGKPLVAAVVKLDKAGLFRQESFMTSTDMNGLFAFDAVAPGRYILTAEQTGRGAAQRDVRLKPGEEESFSLVLDKQTQTVACDTCRQTALLLGRVLDRETGEALAHALVTIRTTNISRKTDNDGVFSIADLDAKRVSLVAEHPDYHSDTTEIALAAGAVTDIHIPLEPLIRKSDLTGSIAGTVIDTADMQGIANAAISLLNTDYSVQSAEDGSFELTGVSPGSYSVMTTRWGYETEVTSGVTVRAKETAYANFILRGRQSGILSPDAPGVIAGVVTTPGGDPFENAMVLVRETGDWANSDYQGRFRIDSIAEGVYTLIAAAEEYDTTVLRQVDVWNGEETAIDIPLREKIVLDPNAITVSEDEAVITGIIVDAEKGAPLAGVAVSAGGSDQKAVTDLSGRYILRVSKPGAYQVRASHASHVQKRTDSITVALGEKIEHDILMEKSDVTEMQGLTVRTVAVQNTDAALLKQRQEAFTVSDAIGADEISRAGAGNAADAMKKVTGATVVGGKYVFIRGLGNRYSNTRMNGIELPSPDPNQRSVPMDLFPAGLLENIVVVKTFTPEIPGNFAGGSVNIVTKPFPEKMTFNVSAKGKYDPRTNLRHDFLTSEGGDYDWLGFDDGTRAVPEMLADREVWVPEQYTWFTAPEDSAEMIIMRLDSVSQAFDSPMESRESFAPLGQSYSATVGNSFALGDQRIGILSSATYGSSYDRIEDGRQVRWELKGHDSTNSRLDSNSYYHDYESKKSVLWGALLNLGVRLAPDQELSAMGLYTRNSEDKNRYLLSEHHEDIEEEGAAIERRNIHYTERGMGFAFVNGNHKIPGFADDISLSWTTAYSLTTQNEPDYRLFSNVRVIEDDDTAFHIRPALFPLPKHVFMHIEESSLDGKFDISIPFYQWSDELGTASFGSLYQHRERHYTQREFQYQQLDGGYTLTQAGGEPNVFLADTNVGLVDTSGGYFSFSNILLYENDLKPNHDAEQDIYACYAMAELPLTSILKCVGGLRFEATRMHVESWEDDSSAQTSGIALGSLSGKLISNDWLPSASLIYSFAQGMNLRVAYSRTVARPTFREKARYVMELPGQESSLGGNPALKITHINNADLRWEWYLTPAEIIAVSGFYKHLANPIDLVYVEGDNDELIFDNVDEASVIGAEFEIRKDLGMLTPALKGFSLGSNVTLMHSRIDVDSLKAEKLAARRTDPTETRPLKGASPIVINANLYYANEERGLNAAVTFNFFGSRLDFVTQSATPDVYELPQPELNASISQKILPNWQIRLSAKNLLNPAVVKGHPYNNRIFARESYRKGRSFSLGLKYSY